MEPREIVQRFDSLHSDRKTPEQTWQWIERYFVPFRGKFFRPQTSEHEIEWRQRLIYDSTGIESVDILANSMQGGLFSPAVQWFKIKFRDEGLNKSQENREWLEECGKRTWRALMDSNFDLEANELLIDLSSFGTAGIVEEPEGDTPATFKGLNFQAVPIREAFFEEDHKGQALRFYRRIQWQALQIVDKFKGQGNIPESIKTRAESPETDQKIEVIFCVYEREDKRDADVSKPLAAKERPYGFKYVLKESGEMIGQEGGYYEMPAFIPRWKKVSGSKWGHSPAHLCLSNVLTLNQVWDLFLTALEKGIDPVQITERRNIYGDFNHEAGSVNQVRDIQQIRDMVVNTRMDMTQFGVEALREQIRGVFHVDQLELKQSPAMTATEVMARMELMNRLYGPTMGRLKNDLMDPMVQRSFNILWRAGQLPRAPEAVIKANSELDIEYQGPLSRAAKVEEVAAVEGFVANVSTIAANVSPAAKMLDKINWDGYADKLAEMREVPPDIMLGEDEVKKIRDDRAAEAQKRMQIEDAAAAGAAAEQVGKGVKSIDEASANVTPIRPA